MLSKVLNCAVIGSDFTNGGVTSGKTRIDVEFVQDQRNLPTGTPELTLVVNHDSIKLGPGRRLVHKSGQVHTVRAVPLNADGSPKTGGMFGGNWIISSDSRFPYDSPIPVHDRFEW